MSDEKRQLLIEALEGVESSLELRYSPPRVRAEMLADRVIAEGWQWHPPKESIEEWRRIPTYPTYEMTKNGVVRSIVTQQEPAKTVLGDKVVYLLMCWADEGHVASVRQLLNDAFPTEDLT